MLMLESCIRRPRMEIRNGRCGLRLDRVPPDRPIKLKLTGELTEVNKDVVNALGNMLEQCARKLLVGRIL